MAQPVLSRALLDAWRGFEAQVTAGLRDRGVDLTPGQARAILLIDRSGTRLGELAQRAATSKQAMMQIVDELQSRGCVRRAPDPGDSRAKLVKLTAKGLRQRAETRRALMSVEARVRRSLGDRRFDALRVALADLTVPAE